jgi:hypothetical protein
MRVFAAVLIGVLASVPAFAQTSSRTCETMGSFDRNRFTKPTTIDNQWLPFKPGTQFTLEGRSNRGGGVLPHRVVLTVTDLTKVVNGVRTVVLWDQDLNEGELEESEIALMAQDDEGNVWALGEYPEEYDNGKFSGAPKTWIAGIDGAEAGLAISAAPRMEAPAYRQGLSPKIAFLDCARVFAMEQHVCVPASCGDHVLVMDEWSPNDPESGHQRKFYAPGVGNIQIGAVDDPEDETMVLVKVVTLSPQELAAAREAVVKLERHAMQVSAVYRQTPPAEQAQ